MTGVRAATASVLVWCAAFAVPHVYWALGGRGGLGSESAAADEALSTPWFAAYNGLTTLACVAGTVLATLELRTGRLAARWWRVLAAVAVLLAARGAIGVSGLVVAAAGDGIDSPPVLVAVEVWFLLGAAAFGRTAYAARPRT